MGSVLRLFGAWVAGVLLAGVCVALVEGAGHAALAGPALFWAAAFGAGLGALVGGSVAVLIGRSPWLSWAVAAALAVLTLINVFSFAHPVWFLPVTGLVLVVGAWLAVRIAARFVRPS